MGILGKIMVFFLFLRGMVEVVMLIVWYLCELDFNFDFGNK